jgi:hypothetical protein
MLVKLFCAHRCKWLTFSLAICVQQCLSPRRSARPLGMENGKLGLLRFQSTRFASDLLQLVLCTSCVLLLPSWLTHGVSLCAVAPVVVLRPRDGDVRRHRSCWSGAVSFLISLVTKCCCHSVVPQAGAAATMTARVPLSRPQMVMETRTVATSSRALSRSRTESAAAVPRIVVRTNV